MRHLTTIVLLVAAVAALGGCAAKTSDRSLVFVSPAEGQKAIAKGRGILGLSSANGAWVDPRPRRAYDAGHIPGAVHLPIDEANRRHRELDDFDTIIVYGDADRSPDALAMSKLLVELGHDRVMTLRGGLDAWEAAGNPVERRE